MCVWGGGGGGAGGGGGGRAGGGGGLGERLTFPIYLYRKLIELFSRNHWLNLNIISQKYFFDNPLPGWLKPS